MHLRPSSLNTLASCSQNLDENIIGMRYEDYRYNSVGIYFGDERVHSIIYQ